MRISNKPRLLMALFLSLVISIYTGIYLLASPKSPTFIDVPTTNWAYPYIEEAYARGLISGVGGDRYAPDDNVTYAQFAAMLVNVCFPDSYQFHTSTQSTASPWYSAYCDVADQNGILTGTRIILDVNDWGKNKFVSMPITRFDMAQMAANAMTELDIDAPTTTELYNAQLKISDFIGIPARYREAVLLSYSTGLLSGVDNSGRFNGSSYMTRAQASVILCKIDRTLRGTVPLESEWQGMGYADNTPTVPSSTERSAFLLLSNETVQQMMDRLNREPAGIYTPGYLTNGKPSTEENIKEMLAWAQETMPEGTTWNTADRYSYDHPLDTNYSKDGGCASFSDCISDWLFSNAAPVRVHQDFDSIKPGDVIWVKNTSEIGTYGHIYIVLSAPDEDGYCDTCSGNFNGAVEWSSYYNIRADYSLPEYRAHTLVYSRY